MAEQTDYDLCQQWISANPGKSEADFVAYEADLVTVAFGAYDRNGYRSRLELFKLLGNDAAKCSALDATLAELGQADVRIRAFNARLDTYDGAPMQEALPFLTQEAVRSLAASKGLPVSDLDTIAAQGMQQIPRWQADGLEHAPTIESIAAASPRAQTINQYEEQLLLLLDSRRKLIDYYRSHFEVEVPAAFADFLKATLPAE